MCCLRLLPGLGYKLSSDSASHLAQTDVNTALYRILAPTGMSDYFILPSVSTQLFLREGVKVPDHLLHLPVVSPLLQVLAKGFSCQIRSGQLVFRRTHCSWIATGRLR